MFLRLKVGFHCANCAPSRVVPPWVPEIGDEASRNSSQERLVSIWARTEVWTTPLNVEPCAVRAR